MARSNRNPKPARKALPSHKTAEIAIKTGQVDELMVPVANWLNSLPDVQTTGCCEGYDEAEIPDEPDENGYMECHEPYIVFTCHSMESLLEICKRTEPDELDRQSIANCRVDWNSLARAGLGEMTFKLEFFDKPTLRTFIEKRLKGGQRRAKLNRLGFYKEATHY